MIICKQCGVELESWMEICPLCEVAVADGNKATQIRDRQHLAYNERKPRLLKRIFLQIACVLLLSGILATLVINIAMDGGVTWSVYPMTICFIALSYVFALGLWTAKLLLRILTGWLASILVLVLVHLRVSDNWPIALALPILCSINVITMLLALILGNLRVKGLNIVAILFIGTAVLCLMLEAILSKYFQDEYRLSWSVVVSACLLPVTAVIVFMHFKSRNNADLEKIFHT